MSIHPEFAQLILDGKKRVEFRKTRFSLDISYVVIYATAPIKKVIGYFKIQKIQVAAPTELWKSYKEVAGIDKGAFQNYYGDMNQGVAIEIGEVYQLSQYIDLEHISKSLVAPQNYIYLEKDSFDSIRSC